MKWLISLVRMALRWRERRRKLAEIRKRDPFIYK